MSRALPGTGMAINSVNALHLQSSVSFSLGLITASLINSGAYEQTPGSGLRRRCRKAVLGVWRTSRDSYCSISATRYTFGITVAVRN